MAPDFEMADVNSTQANDEHVVLLFPLALLVTVSVSMIGTIGNILVVISVLRFRNLQTSINHLLVSLALCDLVVSAWVMPVAIYDMAPGRTLGKCICNLFTAVDLTMSCCSIWHLCFISFERFMSIKWPIWYKTKRSKSMTISLICAPWTLSIVAALLMIIGSGGFYSEETGKCEFDVPIFLDILVPLFGFVIPASILVTLYVIITHSLYSSARKRSSWRANVVHGSHSGYPVNARNNSSVIQYQPQSSGTTSDTSNGNNPSDDGVALPDDPSNPTQHPPPEGAITGTNLIANNNDSKAEPILETLSAEGSVENTSQFKHDSSSGAEKARRQKMDSRKPQSKERRATTIIIIVVSIFFVCWGPFFVVVTIQSMSSITSPILDKVFFHAGWFAWANSAVNPIIYTIFNASFRKAFKAILMCRNHHRVHVTSQP